MKKIGTSLYICVSHIHEGKVALEDVAFIVTSTAYISREQLVEQCTISMSGRGCDEKIKIACDLWDSGRIFQPADRTKRPTMQVIWFDAPDDLFYPKI